jgi:Bax protein
MSMTNKTLIILTSIGLGLTSSSLMALVHHQHHAKTKHAVSHATPSPNHQQFIQQITQNTNAVDQQILKDRTKLLSLDTRYQQTRTLSNSDMAWLHQLASEYKDNSTNFAQKGSWVELEKRVDVIPPSLVLAQSIQESGWGSSYLAKDAHNYFGQECGSSKTCYHSTNYRHFTSVNDAISAYIHNLNTNAAYSGLRNTRAQERAAHQPINSLALANGLGKYSVLHGAYIASVKKLIVNFNLQQYDTMTA